MGFYPSEGDVDSNGAEEVNLRTAAGAELLGQQASAASLPVVISSDQSTLPISAASLPLPTGAATAALQTTGNTSLANIDAGIPAALGQTTMANSLPIVVASDQSIITVKPSNGTTNLAINTDGSINVVPLLNPPAPANATPIVISAFGDVSSTTGNDTFYTITNTKILTIQTLLAGAEATTGGSIVELFYDPNANLTGMTRISTEFIDGSSDYAPVGQDFTGDGTRRIVLRRRAYSNSAREMFGQWIGYEA